MQSVVTSLVFLVLLFGSVYSCHPCKCGDFKWGSIWTGLKKIGDCRRQSTASELSIIPNTIDADVDGLNMFNQSLTSLQENHLIRFTKLQIFLARYNKINYIHKDALRNMTNLNRISLGHNSIAVLPTELFTHTPNLLLIVIQNNILTTLQKHLFSNLTVLTDIQLQNNEISVVDVNCFINLPSLKIIYLNNNFLKTLQLNILPNLETLVLYNNPWNCDESLCEVINAVINRGLGDYTTLPTCSTPDNIKGKQWDQLKLQDFAPSIVSNVIPVQEGDDIVLQCKYCFAANVTWILNNKEEISRKYHQIYVNSSIISTMILENVSKDRTGKYTCHVENCENCQDASTFVFVMEEITTTEEIYRLYPGLEDDLVFAAGSTTCVGSMSLLLTSLFLLI